MKKVVFACLFLVGCNNRNDEMNRFLSAKKISEDSLKVLSNDEQYFHDKAKENISTDTVLYNKFLSDLLLTDNKITKQEKALKGAVYSIDSLGKLK